MSDKPKANIVRMLNSLTEPTKCRGCGRAIWFVKTKHGKLAPFTDEGVNHFSDCEKADKFRARTKDDAQQQDQ